MSKAIIPIQRIAQRIVSLRGERVLLDFDLAALYDVETRILNQAVKRNARRFPADFMFQLSEEEMEMISQFVISSAQGPEKKGLRSSSQFVMSSRKYRGKRYRPYAFTEQGVAMLSSVRVAHASRVLVSASCRNDLPIARRRALNGSQSPRWRDAITSARDARATQSNHR